MKFVVDDCMNAVLGYTKLSGNVILCYSSVCHDVVMNLDNGLLCGDDDWPSLTAVVFQTTPAMNEFNSPRFHHAVCCVTSMSSWISLCVKSLRPG